MGLGLSLWCSLRRQSKFLGCQTRHSRPLLPLVFSLLPTCSSSTDDDRPLLSLIGELSSGPAGKIHRGSGVLALSSFLAGPGDSKGLPASSESSFGDRVTVLNTGELLASAFVRQASGLWLSICYSTDSVLSSEAF